MNNMVDQLGLRLADMVDRVLLCPCIRLYSHPLPQGSICTIKRTHSFPLSSILSHTYSSTEIGPLTHSHQFSHNPDLVANLPKSLPI
jgi:hypothetical protein